MTEVPSCDQRGHFFYKICIIKLEPMIGNRQCKHNYFDVLHNPATVVEKNTQRLAKITLYFITFQIAIASQWVLD
jgi:hypothetical protein